MLSQNMTPQSWKKVKNDIQNTWTRVTDEELEQTDGEAESVAQVILEKYGIERKSITQRLCDVYRKNNLDPHLTLETDDGYQPYIPPEISKLTGHRDEL